MTTSLHMAILSSPVAPGPLRGPRATAEPPTDDGAFGRLVGDDDRPRPGEDQSSSDCRSDHPAWMIGRHEDKAMSQPEQPAEPATASRQPSTWECIPPASTTAVATSGRQDTPCRIGTEQSWLHNGRGAFSPAPDRPRGQAPLAATMKPLADMTAIGMRPPAAGARDLRGPAGVEAAPLAPPDLAAHVTVVGARTHLPPLLPLQPTRRYQDADPSPSADGAASRLSPLPEVTVTETPVATDHAPERNAAGALKAAHAALGAQQPWPAPEWSREGIGLVTPTEAGERQTAVGAMSRAGDGPTDRTAGDDGDGARPDDAADELAAAARPSLVDGPDDMDFSASSSASATESTASRAAGQSRMPPPPAPPALQKELRLRLAAAGLGEVELQLRAGDTELSLTIDAAQSPTAHAIRQQRQSLADALQIAGVDITPSQITVREAAIHPQTAHDGTGQADAASSGQDRPWQDAPAGRRRGDDTPDRLRASARAPEADAAAGQQQPAAAKGARSIYL